MARASSLDLHTESNNDLIVSANNAPLRNLKRLQLGTRLI